MPVLGDDRRKEIEAVERKLSNFIRSATIRNGGNLSIYETYAAALRAIEEHTRCSAEVLRIRAAKVSAKWGVEGALADEKLARLPRSIDDA